MVVEKGANHQVWQTTILTTYADGSVVASTNSYTELGTGMHYFEDGIWKDTVPAFELFPDGAIARRGQHQVILAPSPVTVGAVE